ncbi:MAG TPA: PEP-utilizing enzyme [Anaerolineales bacterium]|nr:PEP-utilizing enzyme [Anaerolineales bacterium]
MTGTFTKFSYDPATGEWNDSFTGEFLWSNVNVSEAVPDVMTPSTWSLWQIYHYETNPVKMPGNIPFCGNICGRPYLNLSLLVSMYQAIGRDARKELQGDMIGSAPADLEIPTIPLTAFSVYSTILPGSIKAHLWANQGQKKIPEFLTRIQTWYHTTREAIPACEDVSSLLSLWDENFKPTIIHACRMLRSVTMNLAEPGTKLHLELNTLVGEADANALLSNLSGKSSEMASLGPLLGLAQVVNGKINRDEYMQRYGHRGPHEMELFAPGSDDDPDWLEKLLAVFTQSAVDVDALFAKQSEENSSALQRFETLLPNKVKWLQRELDIVSKAAKNREAVRSEVTRMTRLLRRFLLRVGEVTELDDGIFFLSLNEMTNVLGNDRSAATYIPARRETYLKYSSLPPYPSIIIGKFDPFQWAADPNRRSDYFDSRSSTRRYKTATIKGFAGAAGCVDGIVRRIDCVEDGDRILPGEILVTTITNIGWTPLFPRLAAIVTDVGAPLSHAAIVAREMGIPAVVGCGNATMLLKTGDRVRVDGGRGTVEILS